MTCTAWDRDEFASRLFGSGFAVESLGVSLEHAAPGVCRVRVPYRATFSRGDGVIHGGVIGAVIDNTGSAAVWTYPDIDFASRRGFTVNYVVNFLSPAIDCDILAEATVVRRGHKLSVIDVKVSNDAGDLIATGTVTYRMGMRG